MAMHDLPGVVGTGVGVVGTEKIKQILMLIKRRIFNLSFSKFASLHLCDAQGFKAFTCNFSERYLTGISYA